MGLTSWVLGNVPPSITDAMLRTKRNLFPSARYSRLREIYDSIGRPDAIMAGPFKGMRYFSPAGYLCKMLGAYEKELDDSVEQLCAKNPDVIINIGSAEGFYAVGLARRLPQSKVIAYDIAPLPRYRLAKLANLNDVTSRIEIKGLCDLPELQRVLQAASRPAVVIDCEGAEGDLLDPAKAPALSEAIVLVETHDLYRPGVTELVRKRFEPTHAIQTIPTRGRTAADLPASVKLSPDQLSIATGEGRAEQQEWLLMFPKN